MPEKIRKFIAQIEALGGSYKKDASGHYQVYKNGKYVGGFAVAHGSRTKRDEVKDGYVLRILKALKYN
jgi:hypothetical protein